MIVTVFRFPPAARHARGIYRPGRPHGRDRRHDPGYVSHKGFFADDGERSPSWSSKRGGNARLAHASEHREASARRGKSIIRNTTSRSASSRARASSARDAAA